MAKAFQQDAGADPWPYSKSEYLRRALWIVLQATLMRCVPGRAYRLRRYLLRLVGVSIGDSGIRPGVRIVHPWLLTVGNRSTVGDRVNVYNLGRVVIGSHTVISQDVTLCAGSHDYTDSRMPLVRSRIHIGDGAWICAEAFIGPGVTIGNNAVVGARSVVVNDVPAGMVVAGNPARVVKPRQMNEAEAGCE